MSSHGSLRVKGMEEGQIQRRQDDGSRGQSDDIRAFKVEGVHEPRDAGGPQKLKKAGGEFSPGAPRRKGALPTP